MERATLISGGGKLKDNWGDSGNNNLKFDKDYPYDYPWPPRYYTCSFCQREFKSAQALGGHMNIHRRDRARLRDQSPPTNDPISDQNPTPNFNLNPNPNPSSQPLSFSHPFQTSFNNNNIYAHQYSLVSLSLSTLPKSNGEKPGPIFGSSGDRFGGGGDQERVRKWKYISTTSSFEDDKHHEVKFLKSGSSNGEIVRLDLELCLGEAKEDLDLELRLGI